MVDRRHFYLRIWRVGQAAQTLQHAHQIARVQALVLKPGICRLLFQNWLAERVIRLKPQSPCPPPLRVVIGDLDLSVLVICISCWLWEVIRSSSVIVRKESKNQTTQRQSDGYIRE